MRRVFSRTKRQLSSFRDTYVSCENDHVRLEYLRERKSIVSVDVENEFNCNTMRSSKHLERSLLYYKQTHAAKRDRFDLVCG